MIAKIPRDEREAPIAAGYIAREAQFSKTGSADAKQLSSCHSIARFLVAPCQVAGGRTLPSRVMHQLCKLEYMAEHFNAAHKLTPLPEHGTLYSHEIKSARLLAEVLKYFQ